MNDRKKNQAFTLAEVLSAVIVMLMATGILMTGVGRLFIFVEDEEVQDRMEQKFTLLLDYLERDIKAAAGIDLTFPAVSQSAKSFVVKIPLFEESGLPVAPATYTRVAYEWFPETGMVRRTEWADELGTQKIDEMTFEGKPSYFSALGNWTPVENILPEDEDDIEKIQIAMIRYEYQDDRFYSRSFIMESLMRNSK
jgi:hypothetical protein